MAAPVPGCAKVSSDGKITQLDGKAGADEVVTAEDAAEPAKVARILARVLASAATLRRQWRPRRVDFEGIVCGTAGATTVLLSHGFSGAVRWWIVNWSGAAAAPALVESTVTADTIQFASYVAGTATIRVEESG